MRQASNTRLGCFGSIMISLFFWLLVLSTCATSCMAPRAAALLPEGYLVKQEGQRVLIGFDDVGDGPTEVAFQWFYFPNLGVVDLSQYEAELIIRKKQHYD